MLTGTVATAVPAAEAGNAAVMESKPAAKVTEDGNATTNETQQASAPADTVADTVAADSLGNIAARLVPGDTVVGRMGPAAGAG